MTVITGRADKVHLESGSPYKMLPLAPCIISHSAFNFKFDNLESQSRVALRQIRV